MQNSNPFIELKWVPAVPDAANSDSMVRQKKKKSVSGIPTDLDLNHQLHKIIFKFKKKKITKISYFTYSF